MVLKITTFFLNPGLLLIIIVIMNIAVLTAVISQSNVLNVILFIAFAVRNRNRRVFLYTRYCSLLISSC